MEVSIVELDCQRCDIRLWCNEDTDEHHYHCSWCGEAFFEADRESYPYCINGFMVCPTCYLEYICPKNITQKGELPEAKKGRVIWV